MIGFIRPGFLIAGALAALGPVALHLITHRPPRRQAFPTMRFLSPDPRLSVRLRRRPTDLILLLLRSGWLLLLGLALAGPHWSPRRSGMVEVVLLDRGAGMAGVWTTALDSVRGLFRTHSNGAAVGAVEVVLFDRVAARMTSSTGGAGFLDSLAMNGPGGGAVDYAAALRALGDLVRARTDADSFRVSLITRPRWEGWSPGFGPLRDALWPGGIRVVALGSTSGAAAPVTGGGVGEPDDAGAGGVAGELGSAAMVGWAGVRRAEVWWRAGGGGGAEGGGDAGGADGAEDAGGSGGAEGAGDPGGTGRAGRYVEAALQVLGWEVDAAADAGADAEANADAIANPDADAVIVLSPPTHSEQGTLLERARAGALVITTGSVPEGALREALPWEWPASGSAAAAPGALVLTRAPVSAGAGSQVIGGTGSQVTDGAGLRVIGGAASRVPGRPRRTARLLAVWEDGRPAAAAVREGAGCLVYLATGLEEGGLPREPQFPDLLEAMLQGCAAERAAPRDDRPLDAAARRLLAGPEGSEVVAATTAAATLGGWPGRPLFWWVLPVALGLVALETRVVYRRRAS